MIDTITLMGLFEESTKTAEAIDKIHLLGIHDEDIEVMTGVPYPEHAIGRKSEWIRLPYIVLAGAAFGFLVGLFLAGITPTLYPLNVGGHPIVAGPPAAIIIFVFTMMATIVSTFLGVIWEMGFPSFEPKYYHQLVTSGSLAVVLTCPETHETEIIQIMEGHGGHHIHRPERKTV